MYAMTVCNLTDFACVNIILSIWNPMLRMKMMQLKSVSLRRDVSTRKHAANRSASTLHELPAVHLGIHIICRSRLNPYCPPILHPKTSHFSLYRAAGTAPWCTHLLQKLLEAARPRAKLQKQLCQNWPQAPHQQSRACAPDQASAAGSSRTRSQL